MLSRRTTNASHWSLVIGRWSLVKAPSTFCSLTRDDASRLRKLREESEQRRRQRRPLPHTEPAPSGRASCKQCGQRIELGTMRVVLGREVEFGGQVRVGPINVHPKCVPDAVAAGCVPASLPRRGDALCGTQWSQSQER